MITNAPRLVSASAGTGKTYWIVQQIVELLVEQGVSLDHVGVITFTEAAAAELRVRIASALKARQHPGADQVAGSFITTINGFALGLVKRHGLALGLPAVTTLDEPAARRLRSRVLNRIVADDAHADALALLKEGRKLEEVEGLIGRLMDMARCVRADATRLREHGVANARMIRDAFGSPGDAPALDAALDQAFTDADLRLPRTDLKKTDVPIMETFRQAERALGRGDRRQAALLALKLKKSTVGLKPILDELRTHAEAWLRHHPAHLAHLVASSDAAYGLAADALALYARAKRDAGCVDFSDQIALALDLLESDIGGETLAELVAKEMPYLFVDEFQDTSPLQFRLAETLREHGCRVAYVGDLKQAIYGWRDADSRLMAALLETGEPAHELGSNWRSRPELVGFCNDVFSRVFAGLEMGFTPVASASRHNHVSLPQGPCVELVVRDKGTYYPKAEMLIPRLQELVASGRMVVDKDRGEPRPVRWSDIAVLERGNAQLDEWAAALAASGLPFTRELGGWCQRPEVRGAVAWLRCLANPRDSMALATALCSSYFGLRADQLAALPLDGWLDGTMPLLEDPVQDAVLRRFQQAWQLAFKHVRKSPLSAGIRAALDACDAFLVLAAGPDADQARANVIKVVELAAKLEALDARALQAQGLTGATPEDFLTWLAGVEGTDDDVQPLVSHHAGGAIQLLTMHRSKGLEFPVVVVPRLPTDITQNPSRCEVAWPADPHAFLGPRLFRQSQLRFIPDHPEVGDLRDRFGQAQADAAAAIDEACLLYVAFTRARDLLMVGWTGKAREQSAQALLGELIGVEQTSCTTPEEEPAEVIPRAAPSWLRTAVLESSGQD